MKKLRNFGHVVIHFTQMFVHFGTRIGSPLIINPLRYQRRKFAQTLKMAATEDKPKRSICPFCSKPARLCLCNRIPNPGLENSVSVTILQHRLERNHPLNSTRIAKLGLNNVTVVTVSDVNFEARFDIRLIEPVNGPDSSEAVIGSERLDQDLGIGETQNGFGLERGNVVDFGLKRFKRCPEEKSSILIDTSEGHNLRNNICCILDAKNHVEGSNVVKNQDLTKNDVLVSGHENGSSTDEGNVENDAFALQTCSSNLFRQSSLGSVSCESSSVGNKNISREEKVLQPVSSGNEEAVMTMTVTKYGVINDLAHNWMPPTGHKKPNFDQVLDSQAALDALAKGFVVKKSQKQQLSGSTDLEECEEFELEVYPGSVLLFPSDRAVGVDDLEGMNLQVKNLIVLDGTWAKAKRMYNENPWLKLLPHLKLDLDKMSLYSEVRHEPKAGYLSTIESIVYALKALGENIEELDNLLDVFESMVGDQRRCKDERLRKVSTV